MSAFTKGPWINSSGLIRIADENNRTTKKIAKLYYWPGNAEGSANARLIAAAPTLYSFVASKADSGDNEALKIIKEINNAS